MLSSHNNSSNDVRRNNYTQHRQKKKSSKSSFTTIQLKVPSLKNKYSIEASTIKRSFGTSRDCIPSPKKNYFPHYSILPKEILAKSYHINEITLLTTDAIAFALDLIVLIMLFVNHFEFNHNGYSLRRGDNVQRIICLVFTVIVIVLKVFRRFVWVRRKKEMEYVLKLRTKVPKLKIKWNNFTYEIVTHILQPYPYVDNIFTFRVLGLNMIYSADIFLFFFSLFRLYTGYHLISSFSQFFSTRSIRIYSLLHVKKLYSFYYRAELQYHPYKTISSIFVIVLLLSTALLVIFEFYQTNSEESEFGHLANSFWYIFVTMVGSKLLYINNYNSWLWRLHTEDFSRKVNFFICLSFWVFYQKSIHSCVVYIYYNFR